ncbi:hypothetical protein BJ742DRAFT_854182 [Cladochytrium replicatum]|nr:hypothetical protein BJ742DRAFT_854182 [Cladochytrium replicatum]
MPVAPDAVDPNYAAAVAQYNTDLAITSTAVELASENGHIDVLEWWWNSTGIELPSSFYCVMDAASERGGRTAAPSSRRSIPLTSRPINARSFEMIDWWKASGLLDGSERWRETRYSSAQDHVDVSQRIGEYIEYEVPCEPWTEMDWASDRGYVDVLEWWNRSGLRLGYSKHALRDASRNGHVKVLEWWKNSGILFQVTGEEMREGTYSLHLNVLDWWKPVDYRSNTATW